MNSSCILKPFVRATSTSIPARQSTHVPSLFLRSILKAGRINGVCTQIRLPFFMMRREQDNDNENENEKQDRYNIHTILNSSMTNSSLLLSGLEKFPLYTLHATLPLTRTNIISKEPDHRSAYVNRPPRSLAPSPRFQFCFLNDPAAFLRSCSLNRNQCTRVAKCFSTLTNHQSTNPKQQAAKEEDSSPQKQKKSPSKLKQLVKQYGPMVWKTYWGVYFGTLAFLFAGIHLNILDPLSILGVHQGEEQSIAEFAASVLQSYEYLKAYAPLVLNSPWRADFIVSWVLAEASEPLRIAATCALVPGIARNRTRRTRKE